MQRNYSASLRTSNNQEKGGVSVTLNSDSLAATAPARASLVQQIRANLSTGQPITIKHAENEARLMRKVREMTPAECLRILLAINALELEKSISDRAARLAHIRIAWGVAETHFGNMAGGEA